MESRVTVCIVSREENPRREAFSHVERACDHARRNGIQAACGHAFSPHAVDHARNKGVAGALASQPPFTHLLMVDDDVLIPPDTITALLGLDADIAGGCYPGIKRVAREFSKLTLCVLVRHGRNWASGWFDGVMDCTAVAGGCMLIRRDVFEKVGFPWFHWPQEWDGADVIHKSDDVDFCDRALEQGCTIRAHGNIRCSHLKEVDLGLFTAQPGQDPWSPHWLGARSIAQQQAPPAYGSHIPALQAVGRSLNGRARKIVEYGAGKYSTPLFCNREFYSHVESVISHESNMKWMEVLQRLIPNEPRWSCYLTPMDQMIGNLDETADVVLIDCDYSAETGDRFEVRRQLINAYSRFSHPIVIVHDSNFRHIRPAVESASYAFRKTFVPEFGPETTLLSNNVDVSQIEVAP